MIKIWIQITSLGIKGKNGSEQDWWITMNCVWINPELYTLTKTFMVSYSDPFVNDNNYNNRYIAAIDTTEMFKMWLPVDRVGCNTQSDDRYIIYHILWLLPTIIVNHQRAIYVEMCKRFFSTRSVFLSETEHALHTNTQYSQYLQS